MNVAITRAKRLCVLIGDSGTVNKNAFLKGLIDYFKTHGGVQRSAFDYQGNPDVRLMYGVNTSSATQQDLLDKGSKKVGAAEKKEKKTGDKPKRDKRPSAAEVEKMKDMTPEEIIE